MEHPPPTDALGAHEPIDYDPTAPAVLEEPWAHYAELRDRCPVHRHDGLEHPVWSVSRHADVQALLTDPGRFPNRYGPGISFSDQNNGSLQRYDPPEHSRRRRFLRTPFLPRAVEANLAAVTALCTAMMDALEPKGQAELHDDVASPLPIAAFTSILGVDDANPADLKRWAESVTLGMTFPDQAAADWEELRAFTLDQVRRRREHPAAARPGLLTHLACDPLDDGGHATDEEVTGLVAMMLVAGHETTASLITNAVWRLLEDRSRWERLQAEPHLVPHVIEESLRYDPPVLGICRTTAEPVAFHGVTIPAEAKVMYLMGAANRDPAVFDRPHEFVMDRALEDSRQHLAFGWGIHFCLGAHLARLTARIALGELVARLPTLRLDGPAERLTAPFLWGRRRLPVAWDPRPRQATPVLTAARRTGATATDHRGGQESGIDHDAASQHTTR